MKDQTSEIKPTKLGRNSLLITGGGVISAIIIFALTLTISRYLGAEGFGNFAFAFAILTVFQTFSDGGFQTITIRDVARNKANVMRILSTTYSLIWIVSIIAFLLLYLYFEILNPHFYLREVVTIMVLTGLVSLHSLIFVAVLRANEAMAVVALLAIIDKVVIFLWVLIAIKLDLGLTGIAVAHLIAALCYWVFFVIYVSINYCRVHFLVDLNHWQAMIKEALPLGIAITLRKLTIQLDIFMLTGLSGASAVGLYSATYRIVQILEMGGLSLCSVIYPLLSKLSISSIEKFIVVNESVFRVLVIIISPVITWLIIFSNQIMPLLYGKAFIGAGHVLTILSIAMMFTIPATLFHSSFSVLGKQKSFMAITIGILVLKALLDALLIPVYAELGASAATVVTELLTMVLCVATLNNNLITMRVFRIYGKSFLCVLFSLLMMAPFMLSDSLAAKIIASFVFYAIYLLMVLILQLFSVSEIKSALGKNN